MPALGAEVPAVQLPMLRYAGQIGWALVSQADALKRRGGETGRLFAQTLTDRIIRLNRDSGLNGTHAARSSAGSSPCRPASRATATCSPCSAASGASTTPA